MEDRYLFKGKEKDSEKWLEWNAIAGIPHNVSILTDTICQCTGLTDKNGQKIWENDIVDYLGRKGKVKYECGSFGIVFRKIIDWEEIEANICLITGCDNSLYACENDNFISLWEIMWNFNDIENSIETIEVIGNVFDNPELLESEE